MDWDKHKVLPIRVAIRFVVLVKLLSLVLDIISSFMPNELILVKQTTLLDMRDVSLGSIPDFHVLFKNGKRL